MSIAITSLFLLKKKQKKGRKKVKHIAFTILKHNLSFNKTQAISL